MKKITIFLVSLVFLVGCKSTTTEDDCSIGFHLQNDVCVEDFDGSGTFNSSEDIINVFLTFNKKHELLNRTLSWRSFDMSWAEMDGADAPANDAGDEGSKDYSETNNQVEGVDEMDNVLTDGKYIYIQNYDKVQIVKAYTLADEYDVLDIVKEITFDELNPDEGYFYFNGMYVDQERLIIVGTSYYNTCISTTEEKSDDQSYPDVETDEYYYSNCYYYEYHSVTHVFEYSKESFEIENEYQLSGAFVGSRKINDDLYFVTNEYIPFYLTDNENVDFSIDNYLPSYYINDSKVSLSYEDILYIDGTQPSNFTTFYGIQLDTKEISSEIILGKGGYNLYVSTENIYLTGTKWDWNDAILLEIEEAEGDNVEVTEDPYEIETSILRIEIEDGIVDFGAEGSVPGVALDQFAMDEKGGYIRIVTTTNNWLWWGSQPEINNRLMILDMDLNIVSQLEGLGKEGETVQSTRFVGDYAYVVTFLRTDPFYVIDVSDPTNPVKLDELEIPGFSDYLQPIGENYILGIGYGDNEGGTQGLKISLYDVSDKSNAVVASEIIYPYGDNSYMWTSTVYNHKDLLVSIDKGIISLPYTEYNWGNESNGYDWTYHSGVLVLNLDIENGEISERGRVEHSEANYYDIYVYKSKFISDYLYTISSKYIKVSTIENPSEVLAQIQIGESRYYYYPEEPVEVDPETVCVDGEVLENGECVLNTEEFQLFNEFQHLYTWEELTTQVESSYYVFVYSETCEFCREIEEQMYEFGMASADQIVFFMNVSKVEDMSNAIVDSLPTLLEISDGVVVSEYVGIDEIVDAIQP